ncbi:MAG: hypothetical protein V7K14_28625, partial [Nostoc sp.]|uniref:hypothetical protein n=1 Tax=Nostoc sp. TaxID=1180 RepID=UPI002FFA9701
MNSRVHDYVIVIHQIYYDVGNMFEIRSVVSNPEVLNVKKNPIKIAQNMVLLGEGLKYISLIV